MEKITAVQPNELNEFITIAGYSDNRIVVDMRVITERNVAKESNVALE